MNMTRYVPVLKYLFFRCFYNEKDAKLASEPEDQDYYGIGSRGARWMNSMVIGLVFCQIQPLILIVVVAHFAVCKFVYGYLIVFAESRKSDIGGHIFQHQLRHLEFGLVTYILLMTGYLGKGGCSRPISLYLFELPLSPSLICASSTLYLAYMTRKLINLDWTTLPRKEIPKDAQLHNHNHTMSYIQPELLNEKPGRADEEDDDWGESDDDEDTHDDEDDSEFA